MVRSRKARVTLALASIAWGLLVGLGLLAVHAFEETPGRSPSSVPTWPSASRIQLDSSRLNLVVAAHPRCPCTRASLEELAQLMSRVRGSVAVHVLFYTPRAGDARWSTSAIRARAAAIPGVQVWDDPSGAEARRFGAETSGTVLLYDRRGRRCFAGGITPARGRAGNNAGASTLDALLSGQAVESADFPVFGCPIRGGSTNGSAP